MVTNSNIHVSRYTLTNWHDRVKQTCMSSHRRSCSQIGDLVHTSLWPPFYLARKGTPLASTSSGILSWNRQQAAEWSAGGVLSRTPWRIKVVAQGRGAHREGKERMLTLAEVQVPRYSCPSRVHVISDSMSDISTT